jgi:opacity protein-like surface antigen
MALASSPALAGGFDGPFVQAGVGFASTKATVDFESWFNADTSHDSVNGQLAAGYSKAFGRFNLGATAYYVVGEQDAGKTTQAFDELETDTIGLKLKQTWGLTIEPGYNFTDATLGYAMFGYAQSKGSWKFDRPLFQDSFSGDMTFSGFSFGAGVAHNFTSNVYGYVEVLQTNFGKEKVMVTAGDSQYTDSYKPKSLTGFVGIGWTF